MRMTTRLVLLTASALLIPLAGSCSSATQDRQGPAGTQPDGFQDMTHVIVYRAPDQVPNIAVGCLGHYGFMTTLKNTESSTSPSVSMVRFPEYDKVCAT